MSLLADKKSQLVELVNAENVSAIRVMADELEISLEDVKALIDECIAEGQLQGSITEDGQRFFKTDIKLSEAPVIPSEVQTPEFLKFDVRPGIITSVIGLIVIAVGVILNYYAMDLIQQDFGIIFVLVGIVLLFSGMLCLSRRKTPS